MQWAKMKASVMQEDEEDHLGNFYLRMSNQDGNSNGSWTLWERPRQCAVGSLLFYCFIVWRLLFYCSIVYASIVG